MTSPDTRVNRFTENKGWKEDEIDRGWPDRLSHVTPGDEQTIPPGLLIRTRRREAGLTQQQLAERLEFGVRQVIRWEGGEGIPGESIRSALADVLGGTRDDYGPNPLGAREEAEQMALLSDRLFEDPASLKRELDARNEIRRQRDRIGRLEKDVERLEKTIAALYNEVRALRREISPRSADS